ncbi:MAG: PIN domain nuclease [Clostridiales bacterium]|jgi:predicted nucleic acid-binding protein|nr:PIN domain nuclease [Clostridiales bacterium]
MIDSITEHHTIVLSTYVVDELKRVTKRKFPAKYDLLELFLRELPFELVYTPEKIDKSRYPDIRDAKDLPILVSAIIEDVDVLISGDADFSPIDMEHPEILTPKRFVEKYS